MMKEIKRVLAAGCWVLVALLLCGKSAAIDVSGNLNLTNGGYFSVFGIFMIDTTGMAAGYVATLNATKDTITFEAPGAGTADGQNADSIMSYDIDLTGMTDGQYLKYNNAGTQWIPGTPAGAGDIEGVTAGRGTLGGGTSATVTIYLDSTASMTITGNWVNTTNPWAANEIVSTMATEAEVPGLETDAAHDNFSELAGAASDAQVPNDVTIDTTNATDIQWDQYIEQHQTPVGDYIDPADTAGVASRAYVDAQDNAQDDFSELSGTVGDAQIAVAAVDGGTDGEIADASITAADLAADAVSADELNATGVEAELEAVLDASELQGTIGDAQIDEIKSTWCDSVGTDGLLTQTQAVAGYAPLASPTFTGTVTIPTPFTIGAVSMTATAAQLNVLAATMTDHAILVGSGTDAITPLAAATNGQIPIGSTGADPVPAAITGTANEITVTNGAGTITLSLPDQIAADPLNKDFSLSVINPLHLLADTANIWTNLTGVVYTIDSIKVETDGSVDDFDFILVEMPDVTGAATAIEAMQVSTETGTGRRQDWFTSIDNGTIAAGAKIGLLTADSTNVLLIGFCGHLTP